MTAKQSTEGSIHTDNNVRTTAYTATQSSSIPLPLSVFFESTRRTKSAGIWVFPDDCGDKTYRKVIAPLPPYITQCGDNFTVAERFMINEFWNDPSHWTECFGPATKDVSELLSTDGQGKESTSSARSA